MQTKFAEIWGYKIRYLEEGRSDQSIVLIHGLGGSAERWLKVIPLLSQNYRVIAIDMLGFGYSDKPSEDYTIEFLAKFLFAFITNLGLKSPVLVGTSLGGQVVAQCASTNPSVDRIVLVAPSGAMKSTTPAIDAYLMSALYPNLASAKEAFEMMSHDGVVDEVTISDFVKRMSVPNAKLAFISAMLGIKNSTLQPILEKLEMPALLVWGKHDRVIPIDYAAQFTSSISNCTFLEVDCCGHLPHVEKPEIFAEAVLGFLNSRFVLTRRQ